MTIKDPAILRAERLRAIIAMPEYASTIGRWLDEAHESALHEMTQAKEPYEFHSAQGAYKAINEVKQMFDHTFKAEAVAVAKFQRKDASNA